MVFRISVAIVLLTAAFGALNPEALESASLSLLAVTTARFGWFYLIAVLGFLIFALYLAFSSDGQVRLGADDDEPAYTDRSWFAMLFSAGMGIGLVFWGVAEPISHYSDPPLGADGGTPQAARLALQYTFLHWGLHAWAIYSVIALAIAYFSFRKGLPTLVSSAFQPLLGDRIHQAPGKAIDTLAVLATVFGVATSLGLGTLQINGGLAHLVGIPIGIGPQLIIIAIVTVLYMISTLRGLDRGIKVLSNVNLLLAGTLLAFTLIVGPTSFILDVLTTTVGAYMQNIIPMSLQLTPFSDAAWVEAWTLFYWAWWIAWAPFVGMFIARISRGRTIKEFVLGVLLVPSVLSFIWFAAFGGTALFLEIFEGRGIAALVEEDITSALFITLEQLPFGVALAGLATLLIITFFVTSADSATFVLGMLSSEGRMTPSNRMKITWGVLVSSIAAVLLLSGGLEGLQRATIVAAVPFAVIMVLMCFSILKALSLERRQRRGRERLRRQKLDQMIEGDEAETTTLRSQRS